MSSKKPVLVKKKTKPVVQRNIDVLDSSLLRNKLIEEISKVPTTTKSGKYEMWLTFNAEKSKIRLPVHPESISVKNGSKNTSVSIVGLGEITIKQDRPALVFSFSSFFPAEKFPGIQVDKITSPLKLIEKLNKWKEKKKPVHFIITNGGVNCYCTIENFVYEEAGGDVGTYQYSIELKEYREVSVRKIKVKKKKKGKKNPKKKKASIKKKAPKRASSKSIPGTYTVKKGDSLWNIARKFYGDGSKYKTIYNANKNTIGSNPNKIYPGQVLKIPG